MPGGIIGKKLGMTRIFDPDGLAVAVTVIEAGPCFVAQVKSGAREGYEALQLGFDDLEFVKTDPVLTGLRTDPRFEQVLERRGAQ